MQNSFLKVAHPLREIIQRRPSTKRGHLVLFGELFNRGYANGLVEEAQAAQFKIIKSTVGRRDSDQNLRALETSEYPTDCDHFINVPLEAGFDFEKDEHGLSPVDDLKELGLKNWSEFKWRPGKLDYCRQKGRERFRKSVQDYVKKLENTLEGQLGGQILIAHLMAGGVPRAKIAMPLMNRVFKGTGDRYMPSREFWSSSIGQLSEMNFIEVTAQTLDILIEETSELRKKIKSAGGHISYVAYGYHGTEIWYRGGYNWQSYSPYLQGWAKMALEDVAARWLKENVAVSVYNCPEILTNSSSIFQGVEVPLYALIRAFQKSFPDHGRTHQIVAEATQLLKKPQLLEEINSLIDSFYAHPEVMATLQFDEWPSHSNRTQLEKLLSISEQIVECHSDSKKLMTALLSEIVFRSCGKAMFHDSFQPQAAAQWIGHDLVASLEVGRT
ncbi:MAG: enoyl-acyl carrier protein reductase FabMG [Bdellovibrionales bacterium]